MKLQIDNLDEPSVRLNVAVFLLSLAVSLWYYVWVQDDYFFWGKMVVHTIIFIVCFLPALLVKSTPRRFKEAILLALLGVILGGWFGCGVFYAKWQTAWQFHNGRPDNTTVQQNY